jgi:hypothetical protein
VGFAVFIAAAVSHQDKPLVQLFGEAAVVCGVGFKAFAGRGNLGFEGFHRRDSNRTFVGEKLWLAEAGPV